MKSYKHFIRYNVNNTRKLYNKMSEERTQPKLTNFLYVIVKEYFSGKQGRKFDTELRIVYWPEDYQYSGNSAQFVVYGTRPRIKYIGEFTPYRLCFYKLEDVIQFVNTVVSPNNNIMIELQQFSGINNDSDDEYNIDWMNTSENMNTELVAFEIESGLKANGDVYLNYGNTLSNVLNVLVNSETV